MALIMNVALHAIFKIHIQKCNTMHRLHAELVHLAFV